MSELPPAEPASGCPQSSCHEEHFCRLMEQGRTVEILARCAHPAYRCGNCGAAADRADDLCRPKPL